MKKFFLIADDSPGKTLFLEAIIQKTKFPAKIIKATTTEEATTLIEKHTTDIGYGFIDYQMPSENGIVVIGALRKANPNAHIALVTATNREEFKDEAEEAGANGYVCTSFDEETVVENLMNLLDAWKD